jgi:hypothetical protein
MQMVATFSDWWRRQPYQPSFLGFPVSNLEWPKLMPVRVGDTRINPPRPFPLAGFKG